MKDNDAPLLIDVSRLIWRRWTGTRATGVDRICQAWMEHYAAQSQAVIIHRRGQTILPFATSQALFTLLGRPCHISGDTVRFRAALSALALRSSGHLRDRLEGRGRVWLNPGHTGLDAERVAGWVRRRDLRLVPLVHDLIPITHPQYCRRGEDERHRRRMRTVLDIASGVVTNSAHTLEVLSEFAAAEKRPMPPVTVAWPGTPLLPGVMLKTEAKEPSFVVLGTIEGRKNHALLLEIWRKLLAARGDVPVPRLCIVGRRGWEADNVFAQLDSGEFGDWVVEVGPLDDQRLGQLLAGARALLFPSLAEGYGIPLVEALAAKVPVIASDLPVFQEIGQGVPELLPPDDTSAWYAAVCDYASEDSTRRAAQVARLGEFRVPDWHGHFARIDAFLETL